MNEKYKNVKMDKYFDDSGFLEPLAVGWKDRGHGHGDYGVIDASGKLIAEIKTGLWYHAILFATAPKLLEGCRKALTCGSLNSDVRALIQGILAELKLPDKERVNTKSQQRGKMHGGRGLVELNAIIASQNEFREAGYQWRENFYNDGFDDCYVKFTKSTDPRALIKYPEPKDTVGWGRFPRVVAWSKALEWLRKQK